MQQALKSLPMTPQDAYDQVMERMTLEERESAFDIMSWIFFAPRPILMGELREARIVVDGEKEFSDENIEAPDEIIDACQGLVVYDEQTNIVRFAHHTVQVYLKDNCSSSLSS